MKILQINSVYQYGSTGRIVKDISEKLIFEGNYSQVLYGRKPITIDDSSKYIEDKRDMRIHGLLSRVLDLHGFGSKKSTERLIKEITNFQPNIIHLHNLHGYYVNIEILFDFLKKYKKPIVWTLHDCWSFTGHCAHFEFIQCNKWKKLCFDCPQKNEYPKSIFIDNSKTNFIKKKNIFTGVDNLTIVTPSRWLCERVKSSFLKEYTVKVINNGIDLDIFRFTESNLKDRFDAKDKKILLGVASVWSERKGINYFFKLAEVLNDKYKIILLGVSEKQKRNLPKEIIGVSRTSSIYELAKYYSMADVFINPTLEDTFPTTNLEALACGTPVITFDIGGSSESINQDCGIAVQKNDFIKLKRAIESIDEIQILPSNCRRQALKYDKIEKYSEYLHLYQMLFKEE